MPTLLRIGGYRFFFYSADREEPPHVHIERERQSAKFWLDPARLASSGGLSRKEIDELYRLVVANRERFLRSWHDFFND